MALKALSFEGLTYYHNKIKTLLSGKVDKEDGKGLSSNDYTTAEKTKLAGIETGADANVIETVQVNGSALSVTDKKVNVDLSAYALKSDISAVYRFKGNVATYADLPNTNQTVGDVYNVEEDGGNYAWTGEGWDDLAGVVDLTEYYTKEEADGKYVGLTGTQTVGGDKTFTGTVISNGKWNDIELLHPDIKVDSLPGDSWIFKKVKALDADGNRIGELVFNKNTDGSQETLIRAWIEGSEAYPDANGYVSLGIRKNLDGTVKTVSPTPADSADNSQQIATTAWVNLADSVVHTTGNETIGGTKTFTNPIHINVSSNTPDITMKTKDTVIASYYARANAISDSELTNNEAAMKVSNGSTSAYIKLWVNAEGVSYATAPATRETGYGSTDIATCGWVETKIATGGGEAITNEEIDAIFA